MQKFEQYVNQTELIKSSKVSYFFRWLLIIVVSILTGIMIFSGKYIDEGISSIYIIVLAAIYNLYLSVIYYKKKTIQPFIKYISSSIDILLVSVHIYFYSLNYSPYAVSTAASLFIYFIMIFFSAIKFDKWLIIYTTLLAVVCFNINYALFSPHFDEEIVNILVSVDWLGQVFKTFYMLGFGLLLLYIPIVIERLSKKQNQMAEQKRSAELKLALESQEKDFIEYKLKYEQKVKEKLENEIFERKQTEQELAKAKERLDFLISATPAIVYEAEPVDDFSDFKVNFLSYNTKKISGYAPKELKKKLSSWKNMIHPEDLIHTSKDWPSISKIEYIDHEYRLKQKDGTYRWIRDEANVSYNPEKGSIIVIGYLADITRQKQAELALKKSEKKLKELNRTKDKFFSIIAHDLKNPFSTLLSLSETLKSNINHLSKDEFEQVALSLYKSSRNAYSLLENLLQWSRSQIGTLKIEKQKIKLDEIIRQNLALLQEMALKKDIAVDLQIEAETYIWADRNMLDTVFRNLISNAIKFTNKGGEINIKSKNIQNEFIEIAVCDTGKGMSKEELKKLFRLDISMSTPGTANEKGTGLGLIICKEFIESNNGDIHVKSKKNKGSCFYVKFPVFSATE